MSTTKGLRTFFVVWFGQATSLVGSGLTSFVLGLWVYERTGSVTQFALIALSAVLPRILFSPLAGALIDRWDRRWAMILSDTGAGISTLVIAVLLSSGQLEIWHIYLATAASAIFGTFQWPAYSAAMPLLVPKKHLGRANGMVQIGQAASEILSPLLAGALIMTIQVQGVILIDVATFLFAVSTLLLVRFPRPASATEEQTTPQEKHSLWQDMTFGWRYIKARPGLWRLLSYFAIVNFLWGMVGALIVPMILDFSSAEALSVIIAIAGLGMLSGSLVMSAWGGPKRRVNGVLGFELLSGFCFMLIGAQPLAWLIAIGTFGAHFTIAIVFGSNQALWQSKIPPDVQGRVFATRQMIARSTTPLAFLIAGPLADGVFGPLLAVDGPLASSAGQLVGVGPGRGIGLLFLLMGLIKIAISLAGYLEPRVRRIEDELPDAPVEAVMHASH